VDGVGRDDPPEVNAEEGFCLALVPFRLADDIFKGPIFPEMLIVVAFVKQRMQTLGR